MSNCWTWDGQGAFLPALGSPVDAVTQTGVNRRVTFDVTSLVRDWLDGTSDNNGFFFRQRDIVPTQTPTNGFTGVVSSLYASSAWGDASQRPRLKIEVIPEPTTALLSVLATGSLLLGVRRRTV